MRKYFSKAYLIIANSFIRYTFAFVLHEICAFLIRLKMILQIDEKWWSHTTYHFWARNVHIRRSSCIEGLFWSHLVQRLINNYLLFLRTCWYNHQIYIKRILNEQSRDRAHKKKRKKAICSCNKKVTITKDHGKSNAAGWGISQNVISMLYAVSSDKIDCFQ